MENSELKKCKEDIVYFVENYVSILDPVSGEMKKLKLTGSQKSFLRNSQKKRFNVIRGPRQSGVSLMEKIFLLHGFCFLNNHRSVFISNNLESLKSWRAIFKSILENLSPEIKPIIIRDNSNEISNSNGNTLNFYSRKEHFIGTTYDSLVVDNAGYLGSGVLESLLKAATPSISSLSGCSILIGNTAGGDSGFRDLYMGAEKGENLFIPNWLES
jgi:hypothetical protein